MTRLIRALRIALILVAMAATAPVLGALIPGRVGQPAPAEGPPVTIGLVQGPIHTDILLPLDPDTRARFAFLDLPEQAQWLAVGWGARGFYTTVGTYADLTPATVIAAIAGDAAVMRYQPVGEALPPATVTLSAARYAALLDRITAETGTPVARGLLAEDDAYFTAPGRFSVLNTCNQWISRSLRGVGQPFGFWTPTTWSVRLSHWWFGPSPSR